MIFRILLLLFVTVPLLELYVLIEVGHSIGGFTTILLCIFTAVLGGIIIRLQGLLTLLSAQRELAGGRLPAAHLLHGLMLGLAGLLLFTPGLVTDGLGFLLLIPYVRSFFADLLIVRLLRSSAPSRSSTARDDGIIDAEVVRENDKHLP